MPTTTCMWSLCVCLVQERALSNLESDCQSLRSGLESLEAELGTELLSQLDVGDQKEVCVYCFILNSYNEQSAYPVTSFCCFSSSIPI